RAPCVGLARPPSLPPSFLGGIRRRAAGGAEVPVGRSSTPPTSILMVQPSGRRAVHWCAAAPVAGGTHGGVRQRRCDLAGWSRHAGAAYVPARAALAPPGGPGSMEGHRWETAAEAARARGCACS